MAEPKIFIRRSATPNKVPTTNQLALGELAINTYDGKLYLEKDPGGVGVGTTVIAVNPWTVGVGSTVYDTYFTAGNVGINSTSPTATLDVNGTLNVSGVSTFQNNTTFKGNAYFGNNDVIYLGDSNDIEIRHNGTHSYIKDTGEGYLIFQTNNNFVNGEPGFIFEKTDGTDIAVFNVNSGIDLYYNGDLKFQTTGAGATVLGTLETQQLNVTGILTAIEFHGNGSNITGIVSISDSSPTSPAAGDLWWDSVGGNLFVYYDDGSGTPSAQWVDASGVSGAYPWVITGAGIHTTSKVGIGTDTNLTAKLTVGNIQNTAVSDKGATAFKTLASTGGVGESAIYIEEQSGSEGWYLKVNSSGDLQLNDSGVSDRITFRDGGNVGINSTAPTAKLDVVGDAKIGIDTSQGVILTSPNGTEYRLIVDNSGNLSTVAV